MLLQDLPAQPQARARELFLRLAARIQRWSHLSKEEMDQLGDRGIRLDILDPGAFETAITWGGTYSWGWLLLYYQFLREAGIQPTILKVVPASWRRVLLR